MTRVQWGGGSGPPPSRTLSKSRPPVSPSGVGGEGPRPPPLRVRTAEWDMDIVVRRLKVAAVDAHARRRGAGPCGLGGGGRLRRLRGGRVGAAGVRERLARGGGASSRGPRRVGTISRADAGTAPRHPGQGAELRGRAGGGEDSEAISARLEPRASAALARPRLFPPPHVRPRVGESVRGRWRRQRFEAARHPDSPRHHAKSPRAVRPRTPPTQRHGARLWLRLRA
mmetsp:Transcript_24091/g.81223  ORF Transcript_24091/g.81223 Transcript_24091/m.81223 type:complete len:226 (+) Transcript_24091:3-680(+)